MAGIGSNSAVKNRETQEHGMGHRKYKTLNKETPKPCQR